MAFDYISLRDETVEPLIAEFGKSEPGVLYVHNDVPAGALVDRDGNYILDRDGNYIIARGGGSEREAWESQLGSDDQHPVTLVQLQFKKSDNKGTLVEKGDVLFLVSTEGVTVDPSLANRFKVDGIIYQVVRIDPLKPGSTVLKWNIHGRK